MNKKSLFSAVGLLAIAVVLVVSVAIINALPGWRVDLTEDELFTLSDGTRSIVGNLEEPLELLFFYSDSATRDAPQIRSYATRVEELLNEIQFKPCVNSYFRVIIPITNPIFLTF